METGEFVDEERDCPECERYQNWEAKEGRSGTEECYYDWLERKADRGEERE